MPSYKSKHTGSEIDNSIDRVIDSADTWDNGGLSITEMPDGSIELGADGPLVAGVDKITRQILPNLIPNIGTIEIKWNAGSTESNVSPLYELRASDTIYAYRESGEIDIYKNHTIIPVKIYKHKYVKLIGTFNHVRIKEFTGAISEINFINLNQCALLWLGNLTKLKENTWFNLDLIGFSNLRYLCIENCPSIYQIKIVNALLLRGVKIIGPIGTLDGGVLIRFAVKYHSTVVEQPEFFIPNDLEYISTLNTGLSASANEQYPGNWIESWKQIFNEVPKRTDRPQGKIYGITNPTDRTTLNTYLSTNNFNWQAI